MTLHAAKGLEFDAVVHGGHGGELFPSRRSTGIEATEEDMAEERRPLLRRLHRAAPPAARVAGAAAHAVRRDQERAPVALHLRGAARAVRVPAGHAGDVATAAEAAQVGLLARRRPAGRSQLRPVTELGATPPAPRVHHPSVRQTACPSVGARAGRNAVITFSSRAACARRSKPRT